MKSSDIAMIVLVAGCSIGISFLVMNSLLGSPSEKKETVMVSKEFTRDSKFEDLATLSGDASNLKFEFNKGVLQTDGNGKYILINGEKYYEYTDDESKQNPALKYFDLNRNNPKGIEIQF